MKITNLRTNSNIDKCFYIKVKVYNTHYLQILQYSIFKSSY